MTSNLVVVRQNKIFQETYTFKNTISHNVHTCSLYYIGTPYFDI